MVTFEEGETLLQVSVPVLDDEVPEDTESFSVVLENPRGGAEIGVDREVIIDILSNDDGHGIVEFAEVSIGSALHLCKIMITSKILYNKYPLLE